jgi:Nickel responsive protein SCO4226-like
MQRYVIERELPGAANLTATQLKEIAETSNAVIRGMGPSIQWEHSYVTRNRLYCVYLGENEQAIREHAKLANFPCTKVNEVARVIGPLTEQGPLA